MSWEEERERAENVGVIPQTVRVPVIHLREVFEVLLSASFN